MRVVNVKNMDNSSTEDKYENKSNNEDMEDIGKEPEEDISNTKDIKDNKTQKEDMEDIDRNS